MILRKNPLETIDVPSAAHIKMASERRVRSALSAGLLTMGPGDEVVWDDAWESWLPSVREASLAYRVNYCRLYTTTIRVGVPLHRLALETARTARVQNVSWDIVPLRRGNMDLLLAMQRGSIDGNVCTEQFRSEIQEALRLGRPVYQKRLHTDTEVYTQGLHPTPAVAPGRAISKLHSHKALGDAIREGTVNAIHYRGSLLVTLDADYRAWTGEKMAPHHHLFSKALLRA